MMMTHRREILNVALLISVLIVLAIGSQAAHASASAGRHGSTETPDSTFATLMQQAQQNGTTNVIVSLKSAAYAALMAQPVASTADIHTSVRNAQPLAAQARAGLMSALAGYNATPYAGTDWLVPAIALRVDPRALTYLKNSPLVAGLSIDHAFTVEDASGDAQVGAPQMWSALGGGPFSGYTGAGSYIAVLDSGVQENHPFFTTDGTSATSRLTPGNPYEACFSGDGGARSGVSSICPNGQYSDTNSGSGSNWTACPTTPASVVTVCEHGSHVAGIAAGDGLYNGGVNYAGVAPYANIMPMQIFSQDPTGGITAYEADLISALNKVAYNVGNTSGLQVSSVLLALGLPGTDYTSNCNGVDSTLTNSIYALYHANIAVVVPTGDDGYSDGIDFPSCISYTMSVGAVDSTDTIASFSDRGPLTTIYAPGVSINSSIPYTGSTPAYTALSGTSMAAAHISGAIALIRQEMGNNDNNSYNLLTEAKISYLLTNSGYLIAPGQPRVQVDVAGFDALPRPRTVGVYRNNQFLLRNSNTSGVADSTISFGTGSNLFPVVGDWNAFKYDQLGVYDSSTGFFYLCAPPYGHPNADCATAQSSWIKTILLGNPQDTPFAGRWNMRGTYDTSGSAPALVSYPPTGLGVYRSSNGILYMKNDLTSGYSDYSAVLGNPGDYGFGGGWSRDGQDSPGVYRPTNSNFYLSNVLTNGIVYSDESFTYGDGSAGDRPVIGNWSGGVGMLPYDNGIGVFRASTGFFYLHDSLSSGTANLSVQYGASGDLPIVGDWTPSSNFYLPPPGLTHPAPSIAATHIPTPVGGSVPAGNTIGG